MMKKILLFFLVILFSAMVFGSGNYSDGFDDINTKLDSIYTKNRNLDINQNQTNNYLEDLNASLSDYIKSFENSSRTQTRIAMFTFILLIIITLVFQLCEIILHPEKRKFMSSLSIMFLGILILLGALLYLLEGGDLTIFILIAIFGGILFEITSIIFVKKSDKYYGDKYSEQRDPSLEELKKINSNLESLNKTNQELLNKSKENLPKKKKGKKQ